MVLFYALLVAHGSEINHRISASIANTKHLKVDLEQMLGEGENAFDSAPTYPADSVDCMTWMQLVLAKAYATPSHSEKELFRRLRYYDGQVCFSHRKHYVDRWVQLDPGPLEELNTQQCKADMLVPVQLSIPTFLEQRAYKGELYSQGSIVPPASALTPARLQRCISSLPKGFYVAFAVPSKWWLSEYYPIGKMARVHSLIIDNTSQSAQVHHASLDYGRVKTESLAEFVKRLEGVFDGYSLYRLRPTWAPEVGPETHKSCSSAELTQP